jgi:hypothetical protein
MVYPEVFIMLKLFHPKVSFYRNFLLPVQSNMIRAAGENHLAITRRGARNDRFPVD